MIILTATFNRAHTISRLYESLGKQDSCKITWIVIDDGSTDNTKELVKGWKESGNLGVIYLWQENKGKFAALNLGLQEAEAIDDSLIAVVDDDDVIVTDSIRELERIWQSDGGGDKAGLIAYRSGSDGNVLGDPFPKGLRLATYAALFDTHDIRGDKFIVWSKKLLDGKRYPVFCGEKRVAPSVIYWDVAGERPFILVRRVLKIGDYMDGGITKNLFDIQCRSPNGTALGYAIEVKYRKNLRRKAVAALKLGYFARLSGNLTIIRNCEAPLLVMLMFPLAIAWGIWKRLVNQNG